ncbi:DNA (Cytosine-5-)-methyltransferase [Candidatus Desulfarcum epimagneticum]|uniref:DNA (cytosine-5-)-methyltransferase n=1 Tax=uncultured Desulfobacteraceae bacterium TaxID=218296 RepID=A0A484HIG2_9BACT|nr:DNA (Cytosine-5-)-methyltransferase [uncultured Desulfobacteraceae bacterium]
MKSVELFAGGGGLGLGLGLAGFEPAVVIEWDKWACDTIRQNRRQGYPLVKNWKIFEGDVRDFDYSSLENVDMVSGGPPCQPFSLGGKHRANKDKRDMFPVSVGVIRKLQPRAFALENVRGITRPSFANYFQYILLQLSYPEVKKKKQESWTDHLSRLERHKTCGGKTRGLEYNVIARVLNAADYGVPQRRERVFIVGFRRDQKLRWSFPKASHSLDALLYEQHVTEEYWDRHGVASKDRPAPPRRLKKIKDPGQRRLPGMGEKSWRTVRDAIAGMPDPRSDESRKFFNHRFQSGARAYPGHTGSPLDMPAKTLKAGDHGVPGGENMMALPDGAVRYFTVRESARLQTFPDGYRFHGSWTETMRQLGNAVPVSLARVVGSSIAAQLVAAKENQIKNRQMNE